MINYDRPDPENPLHALGTIVNWCEPRKPIEWRVVDVFAPGKVSALVSGPSEGKSPLADWIALCVALGRPVFPDRWATAQCHVVYYDSETGGLAEERLTRMANVLGVEVKDLPITFVHGDAPFSDEMLVSLEAGVSHTGAGLVVIDTYGSTLPGDVEHNAAEFSHYLKQLGKLSRATGATVLVLMHETKSSKGGIGGIAGHGSAGGATQSVVTLELDEATGTIDVKCTRHPRQKWETFRMRWEDVPEPREEGAGRFAGVRLDGVSWGLRPVLVSDGATAGQPKGSRGAALSKANAERQAKAEADTIEAGTAIWHALTKVHRELGATYETLERAGGEGRNPAQRALKRLTMAGLVGEPHGLVKALMPDADQAGVLRALMGQAEPTAGHSTRFGDPARRAAALTARARGAR